MIKLPTSTFGAHSIIAREELASVKTQDPQDALLLPLRDLLGSLVQTCLALDAEAAAGCTSACSFLEPTGLGYVTHLPIPLPTEVETQVLRRF